MNLAFSKSRLVGWSLTVVLVTVSLWSCDPSDDPGLYWEAPGMSEKSIRTLQIDLDTIFQDIEATKGSSGVGSWLLYERGYAFVDELYSNVHLFNDSLKPIGRLFGRGEGPDEIGGRIVGLASRGSRVFFLGPSYDYYEADILKGKILRQGIIRFEHENTPFSALKNHPKPHYIGIYEIDYSGLQLSYLSEHEVLLNISSSHPLFNAYTHSEYYRDARTLGILDITSGKITEICGRMAPVYESYHFIPYLTSALTSRIEDGSYLLGYEADTLLYVFDRPDKLQYSFGLKGQKMATNYQEVSGTENYVEYYKELRPRYGFFTYMVYIPELKITFRGYQRGDGVARDGLQIYREHVLVGDVEVPEGFRALGHRKGEFYGEIRKGKELSSEEPPILVRFSW